MTLRKSICHLILILGFLALLSDATQGSIRGVPEACKPVKVCEPVRVVPSVKVCEPVKQIPVPQTCEPVKTCDPVKLAHNRYVYAATPLWHHLLHKHHETVYYATPQRLTTPTEVRPTDPTPAPANAPAPPAPEKA